jgi:hypothetical protein
MDTKANSRRKFNRNLFYGKLHTDGLTLEKLGQQLNPPISRFRACQIVNKGKPAHRLQEIAAILKTNVQTLFPKQEATRVE